MATQPIDRKKAKQFEKTAKLKIPSLVVRSNKTLIPSLMSRHDHRKRYFVGFWWC